MLMMKPQSQTHSVQSALRVAMDISAKPTTFILTQALSTEAAAT
jgi:hypothetical protein